MTNREEISFDVLIVGAGPAGLSAAIKLKQLDPKISVCVLEKGASVGSHILSGAILEKQCLSELFTDWYERGAPVATTVKSEEFLYLGTLGAKKLPTLPAMNNHGNMILSLSGLCRWLGEEAEKLGVEIFAGFSAVEPIIENDVVCGVITGDMGIAADGSKKMTHQEGIAVKAKHVLIAEGVRGTIAEKVIKKFELRNGKSPQTYALGFKEVWNVTNERFKAGHIVHTVGFPLNSNAYGGGFLYHYGRNLVALGLVIGLDYQNPSMDLFKEFQNFKTHRKISRVLEGAERVFYGAKALNEGGWQSMPKLSFPGGALIGCSAGMVNVAKIKGIHNAIRSGMLAAESIVAGTLENFDSTLRKSQVGKELYKCRNIRPAFARFGLLGGMIYSAFDNILLGGNVPWTFSHQRDNESLKQSYDCTPIKYMSPDNKITFDRASSVFLSNISHDHDQPCHLVLKDESVPINHNYALYDAPEQRYCPAGVYEIVEAEEGFQKLKINSQNCIHCKTCDIKDPTQNIKWTPPEGGSGPNFSYG